MTTSLSKATSPVSVERRGPRDSVLWVQIDNPPVNALGAPVRAGLTSAAEQAHGSDVRVVVLLGNSHCFSAGGDIKELAGISSDDVSAAVHEEYLRLYKAWYDVPVPTIAGVRRYALGGALELALSCDLRYAAADAFFAASGVAMGLVESAHSLPGALADGAAAEMLFTAMRVGAADAQQRGLINRVVADLDADVAEIAESIAAHSGEALRATKAVLRARQAGGRAAAEAVAVRHWRRLQRGRDHKELAKAFFARRKG